MKQRLLKQFILHYTLILTVTLLLSCFALLLFFYYNVYRPLLGTAEIYELKGKVNAITIKTDFVDKAADALKQKTSAKPVSLAGIDSPF